ncbi:hypothetical protein [Variovorax atrisoli]|uniref:hypothetical protein n=1 Tax=Variovorax atrisoli TaxID=3394203 RepID=UPI0038632694
MQEIAEVNAIPELIQLTAGVGCTILPLAAVAEEPRAEILSGMRIEPAISRPMFLMRATTRPQTAAVTAVLRPIARLVLRLVGGAWPARLATR